MKSKIFTELERKKKSGEDAKLTQLPEQVLHRRFWIRGGEAEPEIPLVPARSVGLVKAVLDFVLCFKSVPFCKADEFFCKRLSAQRAFHQSPSQPRECVTQGWLCGVPA